MTPFTLPDSVCFDALDNFARCSTFFTDLLNPILVFCEKPTLEAVEEDTALSLPVK
jgi:hypothetical protein